MRILLIEDDASLAELIRVGLQAHGFTIDHVEEFCPTPEQIAARPELADEVQRPMFLIIRARA